MERDILEIIERLQEAKARSSFSLLDLEEEFMYFGSDSVMHDVDGEDSTFCETNIAPPYLYPTESLCLRTWRLLSLPEDLEVQSEGCVIKQHMFKDPSDEELGLVETHFVHTYFRPTETGYISIKSGGVEAKVSWELQEEGVFLLKDFSGRMLLVHPTFVKEIRTAEEESLFYERRENSYKALEELKSRAEAKEGDEEF